MLSGIPVELPAILAAREERAARQNAWQKEYACPLISFTLNIPGPIKTSTELRQAFDAGLAALKAQLDTTHFPCIAQTEIHAETIKALTTDLEEHHPLGRLFDLDVLAADGTKLSRPLPRRCLLCAEQAQNCARSRRHSVRELTDEIERLLAAYL